MLLLLLYPLPGYLCINGCLVILHSRMCLILSWLGIPWRAGIVAFIIAFVTISFQTIKAANINPVKSLVDRSD